MNNKFRFDSIEEALEDFKNGKPVIVAGCNYFGRESYS